MPKNKLGGKRFKRVKKAPVVDTKISKNVQLAEEGQLYALVIKNMGGSRLDVECSDGIKRSAIIPGKFKRRVWMYPGDIILVSVDTEGDNSSCYINHKYKPTDVNTLRMQKLINFGEDTTNNMDSFQFDTGEIPAQRELTLDGNSSDSSSEDDSDLIPVNNNSKVPTVTGGGSKEDDQFNFDDI